MKLTSDIKSVLAVLLISYSLTGLAQPGNADSASTTAASETKSETAKNSGGSDKYAGYSVDGRTSASVIAAKRSHAVSDEDERGLAVYSGLIVIGLIVFFVYALTKRK